MISHLLIAATLLSAAPVVQTSEASPSARSLYWQGRAAKGDERQQKFAQGMAAARAVLKDDPNNSEGLFWLAANLGAEALERGKFVALGILPEMEALLLKLDSLDPMYENAAPSRTLAHLYDVAPAFISIGSSAKAHDYYERTLALAPNFPGNWAMAARFFDGEGEDERARVLAQKVLKAGPIVDPEAKEWLAMAHDVLGTDPSP